MSLIFLDKIVKEYRSKLVLNGASLRVERKERLALTGPNGSGKTTLIRIIMGTETCDSGNVVIGKGARIGYLSQDLSEMNGLVSNPGETAVHYEKVARLERKLRQLEKRIEEVAGTKDEASYSGMLGEYSRLMERYEALDGYSVEARIKATLYGLGLKAEALNTPVQSLSGGEQMRVAIARLLLEEPDLLILDEPTNHLDLQATEWLEGFLKRFEGGVLFVSHDRYFLDQVATRVAELDQGSIIERSGSYSDFIEQKRRMAEYAEHERKRLEESIRIEEQKALSLKGQGKHRTRNISAWKSREKMVAKLREKLDQNNNGFKAREHLNGKSAPRIRFKSLSHLSAEIAKAEGLCKEFSGRALFRDVNFFIRGGDRIGIIGPNGCGKTTLLNILLGKDSDFKGFARLGDWVRYGFLGQRIEFGYEGRTIIEEFMGRREMDEAFARDKLSAFQFYGDDVNKKIEVLSGGERVRLHLACIMLEEPDCLIMDEPTNHLDVPARDAVMDAISHFKGSLIAVSHDRYFLTRCVNRILEFDEGVLRSYQGNYEAYKRMKNPLAGDTPQEDSRNTKNSRDTGKTMNLSPGGTGNRKSGRTDKGEGDKSRELESKALEAAIMSLEEIKGEMEKSFGKDTPLETYSEYDALILKLNSLYQEWESLQEG